MPLSHGSDTVRRPDGGWAPLSTSAIALPASIPSWEVKKTTSARPGDLRELTRRAWRPAWPGRRSRSRSAACRCLQRLDQPVLRGGQVGIEPRGRLAAHVAGLAEHDDDGIHVRRRPPPRRPAPRARSRRPPRSARSAPDPRRSARCIPAQAVTTSSGRPRALHSPSIAWRLSASGPVTRIRVARPGAAASVPAWSAGPAPSRPSCRAIARCSGLSDDRPPRRAARSVGGPRRGRARSFRPQDLDHPRFHVGAREAAIARPDPAGRADRCRPAG